MKLIQGANAFVIVRETDVASPSSVDRKSRALCTPCDGILSLCAECDCDRSILAPGFFTDPAHGDHYDWNMPCTTDTGKQPIETVLQGH